MTHPLIYLNGKYLPINEANISVMDRGFLFGDGVYEVIPVFNGKLFRFEQHLARLKRSLDAIYLDIDLSPQKWAKIFHKLIAQYANCPTQSIYLQITRGPTSKRDYAFHQEIKPTLFAYTTPLHANSVENLAKGISAITLEDIRWQRCDIKAITLLSNVLLRQLAIETGAQEAILIRNEEALEGTSSNLFIVKDKQLFTPSLNSRILGGITRDLILELATQYHIPYLETTITITALQQADEIWLTSSTKEVQPVIKLNDKIIGNGSAGPVWHQMIKYYQAYKLSF